MAQQASARTASERRLFEFLAASRPERVERERVPAAVLAVAGHAAVLSLAVWLTVATQAAVDPTPRHELDYTVDLVAPSLVTHDGRKASRLSARAAAARARGEAGLDPAELVTAAWVLETPPPDVPAEAATPPTAVLASLNTTEYAGMGEDAGYTAAQIVADHHDPTADELATSAPRLVAYTEPPQLSNTEFVRKRLSREYPMFLQDEGIGGRVVLWFLVDENGNVRKYLMKQSSGHAALDRAALKVAALMRFRPAVNYDRHVAVWVALPVFFETAEAAG